MTHPNGDPYIGWRKMERGISALQQELAAEQVTHHTEEYAVGSERYERLMGQLEQAKRFTWPSSLEFNM